MQDKINKGLGIFILGCLVFFGITAIVNRKQIKEYKKVFSYGTTPSEIRIYETNSSVATRILDHSMSLIERKQGDLTAVARVVAEVQTYLRSQGISRYLIHIGDVITLGDHYQQDQYQVMLENPNDHSLLKIVKCTNRSIVTVKKKIDQKQVSVSVIGKDVEEVNRFAQLLISKTVEDGKKELPSDADIQVLWYTKDGETIFYDSKKKS